MLDFEKEKAIRLLEVAKLPCIRRVNPSLSFATVWRWAAKGTRGAKLETHRQGGLLYTTAEAVERFLEALNTPAPLPASTRRSLLHSTPAVRRRQLELANKQADKIFGKVA